MSGRTVGSEWLELWFSHITSVSFQKRFSVLFFSGFGLLVFHSPLFLVSGKDAKKVKEKIKTLATKVESEEFDEELILVRALVRILTSTQSPVFCRHSSFPQQSTALLVNHAQPQLWSQNFSHPNFPGEYTNGEGDTPDCLHRGLSKNPITHVPCQPFQTAVVLKDYCL